MEADPRHADADHDALHTSWRLLFIFSSAQPEILSMQTVLEKLLVTLTTYDDDELHGAPADVQMFQQVP